MARMSKGPPSAADLAAFQALLRRIQLRDIQLISAKIESDRSFVAAHGSVDGGAEVALEIGGVGQVLSGPSRIECEMRLEWRALVPNSEDALVVVHETYLVTYDLAGDDPVTEQTLRAFTDNNAAFNVWPFFRESLHRATLRMGLPAYTLPLVKPDTQPQGQGPG